MIDGIDDFFLHEYTEYVLSRRPNVEDRNVFEVPNGVFTPKRHNYNANNKRKKRKKR